MSLNGSEQNRLALAALQERRLRELQAREHVGAAGWAQVGTLEDIIRTGREQLAATEALRQVVHLTVQQLRALPLHDEAGRRSGVASLERLLTSGREQLSAAEALEALIVTALEDVTQLPMREVSVAGLDRIHSRVHTQIGVLGTIIEAARNQADTLERVEALDRLSAEHQARLEQLAQQDADAELESLTALGSEAAARVVVVEHASGEQQVTALAEIGRAATDHILDTDGTAQQKAEALHDLSEHAREQAEALRTEGADS